MILVKIIPIFTEHQHSMFILLTQQVSVRLVDLITNNSFQMNSKFAFLSMPGIYISGTLFAVSHGVTYFGDIDILTAIQRKVTLNRDGM